MVSRPQAVEIKGITPDHDSELHRLTPCDQVALSRLRSAFEDGSPGAFLIGEGVARTRQVIDSFLGALDEQTSVARVPSSCADATSWMRNVIRSIGFKAKDFCLTDLENIFGMFLSFQRSHDLRTVMCIENAQDCSSWVFEKMFDLTELELQERHGLFVIVSARSDLTHRLTAHSSRGKALQAMRDIPVSPLRLAETREFVVQRIKSEGYDDVSRIFEFDAITRLHEICAGTSDAVYGLCNESLNLAARKSSYPVTADTVDKAAIALGLEATDAPESPEEPEFEDEVAGCSIRLDVQFRGKPYGGQTLYQDCISIGRGPGNDVCIPSLLVSRHHALIVKSKEGVRLMDLGSTNGSVVNGERVVSHTLSSGDIIVFGDCRIDFATTDHTLDEIIMADLVDSDLPDDQEVANDSVMNQETTNIPATNGANRIPAHEASSDERWQFVETPADSSARGAEPDNSQHGASSTAD